jgi:hypothetical protein
MWCRDDFEWLSSPSKSQNEQHASPYTLKRFLVTCAIATGCGEWHMNVNSVVWFGVCILSWLSNRYEMNDSSTRTSKLSSVKQQQVTSRFAVFCVFSWFWLMAGVHSMLQSCFTSGIGTRYTIRSSDSFSNSRIACIFITSTSCSRSQIGNRI